MKSTVQGFTEKEKAFVNSMQELSNAEENLGRIDGRIIGTGRSDYTRDSTEYNLVVNDNTVTLIDIPGIEGDEKRFKEAICNSLTKAHMIFYVNGSEKKAEQETLKKIKSYMRDGTSVYALFNVHCQAKKERIAGIDLSYQEELSSAYKRQAEIVVQTEKELKAILGENFRESICLNGLLSFCSLAMDGYGNSTIIKDNVKTLDAMQIKYLKEYSGDLSGMSGDSHIHEIQDIITQKVECFDEYIFEENLKKLEKRLSNMITDVDHLSNFEKEKIKKFLRDYEGFERNCANARDVCIQSINHIGRNLVEAAFEEVRGRIFDVIEEKKGKIRDDDIKDIFDQHKDGIARQIEDAASRKILGAIDEYQESIREAEVRLCKDLQKEQMKFVIALENTPMNIDVSCSDVFKLTVGEIAGGVLSIASSISGGVFAGLTLGGILGAVIGGVVMAVVSAGLWIYGCFAGTAKKVNKAKEYVKHELDRIIDEVTEILKKNIKKSGVESKISNHYSIIIARIEKQKEALRDVEHMLNIVVLELQQNQARLQKFKFKE